MKKNKLSMLLAMLLVLAMCVWTLSACGESGGDAEHPREVRGLDLHHDAAGAAEVPGEWLGERCVPVFGGERHGERDDYQCKSFHAAIISNAVSRRHPPF